MLAKYVVERGHTSVPSGWLSLHGLLELTRGSRLTGDNAFGGSMRYRQHVGEGHLRGLVDEQDWGAWGGGLGSRFPSARSPAQQQQPRPHLQLWAALHRRPRSCFLAAPGFMAGVAAGFNAATLYTQGMRGHRHVEHPAVRGLAGRIRARPASYLDALAELRPLLRQPGLHELQGRS